MRINVSQEEILKGNPFKGLLKMALPLMLLNLINTLYGVVDTYFVGKIGELQVGAVSLVSPIVNCFASFAMGLSAAAIAMISCTINPMKLLNINDRGLIKQGYRADIAIFDKNYNTKEVFISGKKQELTNC